jgi:ectoine hydroxylase-related dioxygenase (phytanoyl-CoA dioxygenase family)
MPDEIAHYRREGWLLARGVLDAAELAALCAEEARFRLDRAYGGPANQTLFVNIQLCHRSEPIRRFCTQGRHVAAVVQLLGPNVCFTHQQFVTKLPDRGEQASDIPFHQDNGYGRLEPPLDVTLWVALVDTDERNGCLWIVPRSHERGLVEHGRAEVNPLLREVAVGDAAPQAERAASQGRAKPTGLAVPMRAGDGVFFTGLTLHRSGPNHSDAARPSLFVRYCDPHVKMVSEGNRPVLDDPHSWMVAGQA